MIEVFINTTLVSPVNIELTLETGASSDPSLQTTWDGSTNPQKNTFVDANDAEIITFIDDTTSTVKSSAETFLITPSIGDVVVIPDINITKNDDSVVTAEATIDLDLGVIDPFPATWDEFVSEYGRGYQYPQPDGETSYRTGDSVNIESTVFGAIVRNSQTLKARNTLSSFLVLNNNNSFDNTIRFTDSVGGEIFGAGNSSLVDYVIDNYTGLGWYRISETSAEWDAAIDAALASTENGFNDWFLPNKKQYLSIYRTSQVTGNSSLRYSPFELYILNLVSSTTINQTTIHSYIVIRDGTTVGFLGKSSANTFILCRKHF